jgi:hypothetical protein
MSIALIIIVSKNIAYANVSYTLFITPKMAKQKYAKKNNKKLNRQNPLKTRLK